MRKYLGRRNELALLEYNNTKFEFGYLYCQRRIGKTTLMEMFRKNKKAFMFFATDSEDIDIQRSCLSTYMISTPKYLSTYIRGRKAFQRSYSSSEKSQRQIIANAIFI